MLTSMSSMSPSRRSGSRRTSGTTTTSTTRTLLGLTLVTSIVSGIVLPPSGAAGWGIDTSPPANPIRAPITGGSTPVGLRSAHRPYGGGDEPRNHPSTQRKSLNFGPHIATKHESEVSSTAVRAYNRFAQLGGLTTRGVDGCARQDDSVVYGAEGCRFRSAALAFAEHLHHGVQYRITDSYASKHNRVYHVHMIQTFEEAPIANANLNINLDMDDNGRVISYGDSSYLGPDPITGWNVSKKRDFKQRVKSWSASAQQAAGQVIFRGDDTRGADAEMEEDFSTPPFNPEGVTVYEGVVPYLSSLDARHSLLSFLALQSSDSDLISKINSESLWSIVDQMSLTITSTDQGVDHFIIKNVPYAAIVDGEEVPVEASFAWIQHERDETNTNRKAGLSLTYKYRVRTNDNEYEAYVEAQPWQITSDSISSNRIEAREPETLMVVDWVRDFRPTGGEMNYEMAKLASNYQQAALKRGGQPIKVDARRPAGYMLKDSTPLIARIARSKSQMINEDIDAAKSKNLKPAYKVFPWGVNAPDEGKRDLLQGSLIELDNEASPVGWHTIPAGPKSSAKDQFFFDTRGNNVYAQDNPDGGNNYENNYRPSGGNNMTFDFKLGWPKAGTPMNPKEYINASVTELFYTNNEIHDLFYRYGFDETSGNFQDYNFGRGGLGNDAVQANAQDGSGMNNANFATPPDGSRPRMRMYSWTGSQPYRDGDFEAGIVIHEYSHGISTRLTGGPSNSGCLGWGEAGGMGEGWGDFFATLIRMHSVNQTEYSMGEWAASRANGIRNYRYSLNKTVNPDTYKSLDKPGYWGVHAIGEVWAEMLFEMAELLIQEHGFEPTLFPPATNATTTGGFYNDKYKKTKVPKHGNTLALQLVVDAMKLQPCRPSFQDARDAILQADSILTKGDNACLIWKAFSKRGLGPNAVVVGSTPWGGGVRTEDYKQPKACGLESPK